MPIMMVSIFHYCLKVFQYCNHALIKCGFCGLVHWPVAAVITGLSLLRPMYYEYPESSEAYTFDHQVRFPPQVVVKHRKKRNIAIFLYIYCTHTQYFFGANILVAPVTQPVDNITQIVEKEIWIPEVAWLRRELLACAYLFFFVLLSPFPCRAPLFPGSLVRWSVVPRT